MLAFLKSSLNVSCKRRRRRWKSCGTGRRPSKRSNGDSAHALCFWESSIRSTLRPSPWHAIRVSALCFLGQYFCKTRMIFVTPAVDDGFSFITQRLTARLCWQDSLEKACGMCCTTGTSSKHVSCCASIRSTRKHMRSFNRSICASLGRNVETGKSALKNLNNFDTKYSNLIKIYHEITRGGSWMRGNRFFTAMQSAQSFVWFVWLRDWWRAFTSIWVLSQTKE